MAEKIGHRIRRLRFEQGLSQRELACPGVSYAYISRIEAGTREPSIKALRKLAAKFGVSVHYLETGQDAVEVLIPTAAIDEHAAAYGEETLRWADLTPEEKVQVTSGLERQLASRLGAVVFAATINRQLEEGNACTRTTAATS